MNEIGRQTAEIQRVEDSGSGPRPLFGLSRFDVWPSAAHCRPTSPSRYSMTTGPIRFGFEAKGSGVVDCTLVHFGELWPTFAKVGEASNRDICLGSHSFTACATPTFRT
jgi:hypothetical protein